MTAIVRELLVRKRELLEIRCEGREAIFVSDSNWLSHKVLGLLFDRTARSPWSSEARVTMARMHGRGGGGGGVAGAGGGSGVSVGESIRLISSAALVDTVGEALGGNQRLDDVSVLALLQTLRLCVPVRIDVESGFISGMLEGSVTDGGDGMPLCHWFPLLNQNHMALSEFRVMDKWSHQLARRFELRNAECCLFPPGYFQYLFVSILGTSLFFKTSNICLWQNGASLMTRVGRSGSGAE